MKKISCILLIVPALVACTASKEIGRDTMVSLADNAPAPAAMPKARIYKISGGNADLVPATMIDGRLISYPAPGDVTPSTAPIRLTDGWLLDRQGLGPNTVFLKWTREEYCRMRSAPSPEEIKEAVEGDSRVSELVELPMTTTAAMADTAAVNRLIAEGLPGCKELITVYHIKI